MEQTSQSRPDSGLDLSHFQYESDHNHSSCDHPLLIPTPASQTLIPTLKPEPSRAGGFRIACRIGRFRVSGIRMNLNEAQDVHLQHLWILLHALRRRTRRHPRCCIRVSGVGVLGFGFSSFEFRVSGFRVSDFGFSDFRVSGFGVSCFGVWGFVFQVSSFGVSGFVVSGLG